VARKHSLSRGSVDGRPIAEIQFDDASIIPRAGLSRAAGTIRCRIRH
jgi:hypothetical protein